MVMLFIMFQCESTIVVGKQNTVINQRAPVYDFRSLEDHIDLMRQ